MEGPPGKKRVRKAKDIARDVAETVAAMANTDGGELVIGIEDDGTITGVDLPEDKIQLVLGVPQDRNYLNPPVPFRARRVQTPSGDCLLCFAVDWSPTVHQLARGQYLLRIRDRNEPFDAGQIAVLKTAKTQGLWERSFPPGATLADLDEPLLERLAPEAWGGRAEGGSGRH